ncbi:hypothetical protein JJB11_25735 [Ramlibacter ginsenosidimutans]|uniref:Uncharacterized protein n=1 Tax=Ramlibacter ginsenosidimutans TaxID=502333 RepID=A0A934WQR3_9BURK|nr:hypothetical protein [Ramlibacter ginsenosidimutans]MBK6009515.1 hypothetical protein [Ramlibacter ginsenosidimutans]
MTNTHAFPGLTLVEPEPVAETRGPGRRWSDAGTSGGAAEQDAPWAMAQQWPTVVAALSEQAVEGSNLILQALDYLVGAGRLRHGEAKALGDAMHQLRATSLRAQQITRLAGGRIRQARERVDLAQLVRQVLQERAPGIEAAGIVVRSDLEPVEVLLDPPVAASLVNAILDWAMSLGKQIDLLLAPAELAGPARLKVRIATPAPAQPTAGTARARSRRLHDGLHWTLLRQIAASSGLELEHSRRDGAALLTIAFPRTFLSTAGVACLDLTEQGAANSLRPTWVLVVAQDERVRTESLDALRKMGIPALAAGDLRQARALVRDSKPDVLVAAWDVPLAEIARFRQDVLGGEERCPLVEITHDVPSFHLNGFDRFETPKVGRAQLTAELPPTVLFELVKVG